ncbi:AAA family ATPase [Virgibacillus sp. C22-A2]|uniref:AAA family ATPase n=1 Tax=Virgibacillus tibetensis TaxID=3042313 RepID=A0ABU6KEI5_9BACI|nr:AAA family ATPase [Virgibacillus sp. C22-A2]
MKIQKATIFGFGKWVDFTIDFTSDSVNVIYGENESGKSTLQKFILFMLFGLPPKQRAFYRPKTSGKMGGRITIYDPAFGNFTVERIDEVKNGSAVCYTDSGQEYDDEWLRERLKGMTYQTYQSIFSFSALDLTGLKDMKEEDLGEVLLGIGLTGSTTIYSVEKRLDNRIGELFKPFGKKPAINQQLDSLDELFHMVNSYKSAEASYREKSAQKASLSEDIDQLQIKLKDGNKNLLLIEKKQHALPILQDYLNLSQKLSSYPAEIPFPEDGIDRLERVKENLLPLKSEHAVLQHNKQKYKEKMAELQAGFEKETSYEEAEKLIEYKPVYNAALSELDRNTASINKLTIQLKNEISDLNIGIREEDLTELSFPFYLENTWKQIKDSSDKLAFEKEQLKKEHNELKNERNYLINQLQGIEDVLLTDKQVADLNQKINIYKETSLLQRLQRESVERSGNWAKNKAGKIKNSRTIVTGFIVASLLLGIVGFITDLAFLFGLMGFMLVVGLGQWVWTKKSISEMEKIMYQEDLHLPSVQLTKEEIDEAEYLLSVHHKHEAEIATVEEQIKNTDIKLIKWNEKRKLVEGKEASMQLQIEEQLEIYPFLLNIEVVYWPDFFHSLKNLLRLTHEREELRQSVEVLEAQTGNFACKLTMFLQAYQGELKDSPVNRQLEYLEEIMQRKKSIQKQLEQYENLIEDNRGSQDEVIQKLETYEKEVNVLYRSALVETEDEFYQKGNQLSERTAIKKAMERSIEQLTAALPEDTWKQLAKERPDEGTLLVNYQQTQTLISNLEETLDTKRQQLADIKADLAYMESSESYSKTLHQYELEKEQLTKLAKEWAVLKTAKEMLLETKRTYREKYLMKVISRTSHYFTILTGNAYQAVYAPSTTKLFQVAAADGMRYTVTELSQGTLDQLYISLRLAISEIMTEKNRMPFIIDDAFVHFDTVRTSRIMDIVHEVAKKQQVILFTCKKEVVESSKDSEIMHL